MNLSGKTQEIGYIEPRETFTSLAIAGVIKHTNARLELIHHIKICKPIKFGAKYLYINPKNGGASTHQCYEKSMDMGRCMSYDSTPEQIAERVRILRNME